MSTPISDVSGSVLPILMTQDSVPLPTPRIPMVHQEEREPRLVPAPLVTHLQPLHFLTLIEQM